MKTVPTWRVILGSVVITTGIVASYSFRVSGIEVAEAAPRASTDAGVGSAAHARGDAGTHPGGGVHSDGGVGSAGSGSATRHEAPPPATGESPPVQVPPASSTPAPVPPGSPGPTGPITPGN